MNQLTNFPPSFQESPFFYGAALFVMTYVAIASLAALVEFIFQDRQRRKINAALDNQVKEVPLPRITALSLYQTKLSSLLATIFIGTLPDAVFLLTWGEVSPDLSARIFMMDRVCDALSGIPFSIFLCTYLFSGGTVAHQLAMDARKVELHPQWHAIRGQFKVAFMVLVIAAGVTFYKAHP